MKKCILLSLLAGIVVALSSCSTSAFTLLNSNVVPGQEVRGNKTFSILEYDAASLPPGITIFDVQNIQRSIANQLSIRGFKEDKTGEGELFVVTTLYTRLQITTKDALPSWSWATVRPMGSRAMMYRSYFSNAQIISNINNDQILGVELVDAKTNQVVWYATVSSVLDDRRQRIKDPVEINNAVAKLFSRFPIPVLKKEDQFN